MGTPAVVISSLCDYLKPPSGNLQSRRSFNAIALMIREFPIVGGLAPNARKSLSGIDFDQSAPRPRR
jgi:hypothetical protein